jgi:uncharacterized membrane protein
VTPDPVRDRGWWLLVRRVAMSVTGALAAVILLSAAAVPRHGPKQGTVAVVFSVIGFIVIIVLVVALGPLAVRRRARDRPAPKVDGTGDNSESGGGDGTPEPPGKPPG